MSRKTKRASFVVDEDSGDNSDIATSSTTSEDEWDRRSQRTVRRKQVVAGTSTVDGREHGGIGLVTFCSDDDKVAWHDHPSTFSAKSPLFTQIFDYDYEETDPCDFINTISRISHSRLHFKLEGVSTSAFTSFLRAVRPGLEESFETNELKDLLLLSTRWNFPSVREYAIKHIPGREMNPMEKIELARAANVPEWLMEPYTFFCRRIAPLSDDEGRRLGLEVVLPICRAREELTKARQLLISGPPPDVLFEYSTWRHKHCWATLCSIWNLTLTKPHVFKEDTPDNAIMCASSSLKQPLTWDRVKKTDQEYMKHFKDNQGKFKPAQLCWSCNNNKMLRNWTQPMEEKRMAQTLLKAGLPVFIPIKFGYEDLPVCNAANKVIG